MDDTLNAAAPLKPARRFFRSANVSQSLSHDAAAREGAAVRFAIAELGSVQAVSFLNDANDALNGRPLTIAMQSSDGLNLVRNAVIERAAALQSAHSQPL